MPLAPLSVAVTIVFAALLLVAEYKQSLRLKKVAKPFASAGFVVFAITAGALGSAYGTAVVVALVLSFVGDVLLIVRRGPVFRAGIFAFLLAHVAFVAAFALRGIALPYAFVGIAITAPAGVRVARWLVDRVDPGLRAAIRAYIAVISIMVAAAAGTFGAHGDVGILVGAMAFYVSDLSVALHRFVSPKFSHRAWGVPLYYGAQLLLAWSATR